MEFPIVELRLVLDVDGCEETLRSIYFTQVIRDLLESGAITEDQIKNYVLENLPSM
jgi:hypothetical protein